MIEKHEQTSSRDKIFDAILRAAPTAEADLDTIKAEAAAILTESTNARPELLADDAAEALVRRVEKGLVIGTSCECIPSLDQLPEAVKGFLGKYDLPAELKVQDKPCLKSLAWADIKTDVDIHNDNTVGLCFAEYGVAETGSFVVHSSDSMPVLLNFLPLYLIAVVPKSKILHYMDDYAVIANEIAACGETPRNMCLISGASGTTDIEGVLVQGAHGPEVLHLIIVEDQ
ncbi:MAG: LutC/YkgG family protein [Neptuniibacter sp.]